MLYAVWWTRGIGEIGIFWPLLTSLKFVLVASGSWESLSSRLFRWFLISLGFALLASIAVLVESHPCLA